MVLIPLYLHATYSKPISLGMRRSILREKLLHAQSDTRKALYTTESFFNDGATSQQHTFVAFSGINIS